MAGAKLHPNSTLPWQLISTSTEGYQTIQISHEEANVQTVSRQLSVNVISTFVSTRNAREFFLSLSFFSSTVNAKSNFWINKKMEFEPQPETSYVAIEFKNIKEKIFIAISQEEALWKTGDEPPLFVRESLWRRNLNRCRGIAAVREEWEGGER